MDPIGRLVLSPLISFFLARTPNALFAHKVGPLLLLCDVKPIAWGPALERDVCLPNTYDTIYHPLLDEDYNCDIVQSDDIHKTYAIAIPT